MHRPPNNDIINQGENASSIADDCGGGGMVMVIKPMIKQQTLELILTHSTTNSRDQIARVYLEESNLTKTVADLFMNNPHNITWKYYDHLV